MVIRTAAAAMMFAMLAQAQPGNGGRMQITMQEATDDGIEFVSVEHFPEYAIGLPVWVALTLRADEETSFPSLAFADLVGIRSCIGLEMIGPATRHRSMPTPVVEAEYGIQPQALLPGETRRMLVDISPLLNTEMEEGEHRIRLTYLSEEFSLKGQPFIVRFRKPNADEAALLAFASGRRNQSWAEWMRACQERFLGLNEIPKASPAALTFVLHALFCGRERLASIPADALRDFEGIPAPERRALEAELLLAHGDTASATELQQLILRVTPGLQWWVNKMEKGAGYLRTFSRRPQ